jgi:hypothetical protein
MFKHNGGILRGTQTALAEKLGFLTQAHKLTKTRRSLACLLYFVSVFALRHFLCNHLATTSEYGRTGMIDNIFMTRNQNYSQQLTLLWMDHLPGSRQ